MLNLNATLDNLIAMVVVLLALSLVVQAVQTSVKKMFKLKSRQIEDSLVHLFQFVVERKPLPGASADAPPPTGNVLKRTWDRLGWVVYQSPFLRAILRRPHSSEHATPEAKVLFDEVIQGFGAVGRTALSTRPIFDSLSKGDLLKVLGSLAPEKIDREFASKFDELKSIFDRLVEKSLAWEAVVEQITSGQAAAALVSADDKARLVDARAKIQPLMRDLRQLLAGGVGAGSLRTLASDIARLRQLNFEEVQKSLGDVEARVGAALRSANENGRPQEAALLAPLDTGLTEVSALLVQVRQKLDVATANWAKVENYFDTVMQSFEERYARSMRTAAIIISFLVVVFLNADFFKVYRQISTSDATRELIIQSRQDVVAALDRTAPAGSGAQVDQTVQKWFEASRNEIQKNAGTFEGYGFQPITLHDTRQWVGTLSPRYDDWAGQRKRDLKALLGWLLMALLLSVGAPFWQDFLESLFGIKNVLRKRSGTQNVEQQPGAGQTKQA